MQDYFSKCKSDAGLVANFARRALKGELSPIVGPIKFAIKRANEAPGTGSVFYDDMIVEEQ
jgi:hypothetical protein